MLTSHPLEIFLGGRVIGVVLDVNIDVNIWPVDKNIELIKIHFILALEN